MTMGRDTNCDSFQATVVAKSHSAMLVDIDGEEVWIPYSQIGDDSELWETSERGEEGSLVITHWIARKKGLSA